jgi:hypothetical protein
MPFEVLNTPTVHSIHRVSGSNFSLYLDLLRIDNIRQDVM